MTDNADAFRALVSRARLTIVNAEEYARLEQLYAELQPQLESLRLAEIRYREPPVIYSPPITG